LQLHENLSITIIITVKINVINYNYNYMAMKLITITITFVLTRDKYKLYNITSGVQLPGAILTTEYLPCSQQ